MVNKTKEEPIEKFHIDNFPFRPDGTRGYRYTKEELEEIERKSYEGVYEAFRADGRRRSDESYDLDDYLSCQHKFNGITSTQGSNDYDWTECNKCHHSFYIHQSSINEIVAMDPMTRERFDYFTGALIVEGRTITLEELPDKPVKLGGPSEAFGKTISSITYRLKENE